MLTLQTGFVWLSWVQVEILRIAFKKNAVTKFFHTQPFKVSSFSSPCRVRWVQGPTHGMYQYFIKVGSWYYQGHIPN